MSRFANLFQTIALISLSAFSGALLFIAVAIVKFWQSVEPNLFLSWMAANFFRFPTIMVPLNIASLLMAIVAIITSWKPYPDSRLPLSLGLASLLFCTITFPIYFAEANENFVSQSIVLDNVAQAIDTWSNWHWFRTGLAILAVISVSWGLLNSNTQQKN